MKYLIAALTFFLFSFNFIHAQPYEPIELAKKIFAKSTSLNIGDFSTGEYDGRPSGQDIAEGAIITFRLLGQTAQKAVVNMTILDSSGKGLDTYLHFEKNAIWKMNAFRALAMTGMIEQMLFELESMTAEQVDEMIAKNKNRKEDFAIIKSRDDYHFQVGNARLTLELDDNIVNHFEKNKAEFERLKDLAITELSNKKGDAKNKFLIDNLKQDYHKLFIASVSSGDYELGKGINFLIGGMLDNTVGYLYVSDKKDLREMNPNDLIMLREIGNGWYIYKTT